MKRPPMLGATTSAFLAAPRGGWPAALASLVVVLAACATTDAGKPAVPVPEGWNAPANTQRNVADLPWGEVFRSPELLALVREGLANNSDLRIAADRVEVMRAQFGFQRSFLFPSVELGASATRQRAPVGTGSDNAVTESASFVLAVPTWELDLWGRVRSATEAARRQLLASEDTRQAIYTSLIAQIAAGYVDLLNLDQQIDASARTAATRREALRLIELRYKGGVASRLELNDQISLVAQADRTLAGLKRQRSLAENALSTLIGRNPGPIARPSELPLYELPAALAAGVPSTVLLRRFDVRAAEETLASADANIDAARKAFFPTITLTGLVGFASPQLRELFDSGRYAWSATPSIGLPIFNAGRLTSNLEQAQAQQRIAVEAYRQTIRTAFREVEDALASYERLTEERSALAQAVGANRERLRLSELRYRAGVSAYFEVLDSSRQLFDSELALIQATSGQYQAVIELYRALGGGFADAEASAPPMPAGPYSPRGPGDAGWY